jgi:hypothetical protein
MMIVKNSCCFFLTDKCEVLVEMAQNDEEESDDWYRAIVQVEIDWVRATKRPNVP